MRKEFVNGDNVVANRDTGGISEGTTGTITNVRYFDSECYLDVKCGDKEISSSSENNWNKQ